jgi:hypothetical protein
MNPKDLMNNPDIKGLIKSISSYAREKPMWFAAGVGATLLWAMQYTGNLTTPKKIKRYAPYSKDAYDLFRFSAIKYGLPESWATDPDLHWILSKESGGWVGKPNYTYKLRSINKNLWPEVWDELRSGIISTKSSATGLGQLLSSNANIFYPDKLNGIGDPVNEATGFMRYIKSRYGSPAVARSVYGIKSDYIHAITKANCRKKFTEGY